MFWSKISEYVIFTKNTLQIYTIASFGSAVAFYTNTYLKTRFLRYLHLCWNLQRCAVKNNIIQIWRSRVSYQAWISSHLNPFCSTCRKHLYRAFILSMEHFPVFLIFDDACKNITSNISLRERAGKKKKTFSTGRSPRKRNKTLAR